MNVLGKAKVVYDHGQWQYNECGTEKVGILFGDQVLWIGGYTWPYSDGGRARHQYEQDETFCKRLVEAWNDRDLEPRDETRQILGTQLNAAHKRIFALEQRVQTLKEHGDVVAKIQDARAKVKAVIDKGKGTWPQSDYVKDETWAHFMGELQAYDTCLDLLE